MYTFVTSFYLVFIRVKKSFVKESWSKCTFKILHPFLGREIGWTLKKKKTSRRRRNSLKVSQGQNSIPFSWKKNQSNKTNPDFPLDIFPSCMMLIFWHCNIYKPANQINKENRVESTSEIIVWWKSRHSNKYLDQVFIQ